MKNVYRIYVGYHFGYFSRPTGDGTRLYRTRVRTIFSSAMWTEYVYCVNITLELPEVLLVNKLVKKKKKNQNIRRPLGFLGRCSSSLHPSPVIVLNRCAFVRIGRKIIPNTDLAVYTMISEIRKTYNHLCVRFPRTDLWGPLKGIKTEFAKLIRNIIVGQLCFAWVASNAPALQFQ